MYKENYKHHNNYVFEYFNGEFSTDKLIAFRKHLLENLSPGTARVRWCDAVHWYRKKNKIETQETLYCKPLWIAHTIPFRQHKKDSTRRLTDREFNMLIHACSDRDAVMFSAIRKIDLKINQLINLTVLSPNVPDDIKSDANRLFMGKKWLFETSGGKKYQRSYIGSRVNKLSKKVLGFTASCESLRPEKFSAGKARLDEYGVTA